MLTVKRKVGETIVINKNIHITFTKLSVNGNLEIKVDAPKDIPVDRLELHLLKEAKNNSLKTNVI